MNYLFKYQQINFILKYNKRWFKMNITFIKFYITRSKNFWSKTTSTQINEEKKILKDNLQSRDLCSLLLFGNVTIYIANNQIIHAPQTGDVVKISNLWNFWRARRILSDEQKNNNNTFFDSDLYNSLYSHLKKAFNGNSQKLYQHYINYGIKKEEKVLLFLIFLLIFINIKIFKIVLEIIIFVWEIISLNMKSKKGELLLKILISEIIEKII